MGDEFAVQRGAFRGEPGAGGFGGGGFLECLDVVSGFGVELFSLRFGRRLGLVPAEDEADIIADAAGAIDAWP